MSLVAVCDLCGNRIDARDKRHVGDWVAMRLGDTTFEDLCERCEAGIRSMIGSLRPAQPAAKLQIPTEWTGPSPQELKP